MSKLSLMSDLSILSKKVYSISKKFPEDEKFNTISQVKRAVISVRLNIREGNVFYDARKRTHFERALGSLVEVDECFFIAKEFEYFDFMDNQDETVLCCQYIC